MTTSASDYESAGSGANKFLARRQAIQTTDSRDPLFGRERGSRTRDDELTGNDPVKRISLGSRVYTGSDLEPIRDWYVDRIAELEAGKNFAADEPVGAEELLATEVAGLAKTYTALVGDRARAKDKRSGDDAADVPPHEKQTKDGRAMARHRNYLPGTNRGISTQAYQDTLRNERAKMATQDRAAPAAKARVTGAEFAALRATKGAHR
jgi:hypothetical protein